MAKQSVTLFHVGLALLCCPHRSVLPFSPTTIPNGGGSSSKSSSRGPRERGLRTRSRSTSLSSALQFWGIKDRTTKQTSSSRKRRTDDIDVLADLPDGLRETLLSNALDTFSKRIWLVDNSGSMGVWDGHLVVDHHHEKDKSDSKNKKNAVSHTRWEELQETVNCQAQLAAALGAPTDFRLLNPPNSGSSSKNNNNNKGPGFLRGLHHHNHNGRHQKFRVGYTSPKNGEKDCKKAQSILAKNKPAGKTSLHESILEIRREIVQMLPQLHSDGTKVAVVICTDGSNNGDCNHQNSNNNNSNINDGTQLTTAKTRNSQSEAELNKDVVEALQSLAGLPVCVVVRLCTDLGQVVDFYNDLDKDSLVENLTIDVLDDHVAESAEVYEHNPWLNYALLLHRMREMGLDNRLFDLLDERPFTKEEVKEFCVLLFGNKIRDELPADASADWTSFVKAIEQIQNPEKMHLNPRTGKMAPWIDLHELALVA